MRTILKTRSRNSKRRKRKRALTSYRRWNDSECGSWPPDFRRFPVNNDALALFVQDQFRRIDRWTWETIIEEVAQQKRLTLDPDKLTYAAGSIRHGRYRYLRNDKSWRTICARVLNDTQEAARVIEEVTRALESDNSAGVAAIWTSLIRENLRSLPSDDQAHAAVIVQWRGLRYMSPTDFSAEIESERGIVYGLWRLGEDGQPLMPLPLYIGEAAGSMHSRLVGAKNKCHRDWWGDGKPIGVSLTRVEPAMRKEIEARLIAALLPFGNSSKSQWLNKWHFPQP